MDDITRLPGARSAQYEAAHPGTVISRVEGTWRAWLPDVVVLGDDGRVVSASAAGEEYGGRTEDELLAKLPG